jgi:hypothetical protein
LMMVLSNCDKLELLGYVLQGASCEPSNG